MNNEYEDLTIAEIKSKLVTHACVRDNMNIELLIESISKKLSRRQAIILRLMLISEHRQTDIAKMLGFSTTTICLEIKKIREIVQKLIRD